MWSEQLRNHRLAALAFLLISGVALVGLTGVASAAASLQVTPDSGLTAGSSVTVSGSGFAADSTGGIVECNSAAVQPTIDVAGNAVPVSCTNPLDAITTTSASGTLSMSFSVQTGTVGPPASGTDSSGGDAATDAASYPCPPTAAQLADADSCVISFGDQAGDQATASITVSGGSTTTTTTTTTTATTQPSTTPTTLPVCAGQRGQVTTNGVMMSVNPSTCLVAGVSARVEGSGLSDSQPGALTECSTAGGQGTTSYGSLSLPVSCVPPLALASNSDGSLGPAYITVGVGTLGSGAASSAYPCPPTAAQLAAGATCVIAYASTTAILVQIPVSFAAPGQQTLYSGGDGSGNTNVSTAAATLVSPAASTSPATSATRATVVHSAGSLAFTGAGPGIWTLGLGGLFLIDLGYLLLTIIGSPRELLRRWRKGEPIRP